MCKLYVVPRHLRYPKNPQIYMRATSLLLLVVLGGKRINEYVAQFADR